jgi:hypothetical protein
MSVRLALTAAVAALALLLGGCTGQNETATLPSNGSGTQHSAQTPEETAKAAAIAKVREFYSVWAKAESGALPPSALSGVAGDPIVNNIVAMVYSSKARNLRSEGEARVLDPQTPELLVPTEQGKAKQEPAWVRVTACVDSSSWITKNPDGSNADPGQPQKSKVDYKVRNLGWPDANGWRVTGQAAENTPC